VSARTSEVLVYQVGARVFASEVHDVARIGSPGHVPADEVITESALGAPLSSVRGLVVAGHEEGRERTLLVDHVLGVSSVLEDDIRPLPPFAVACLASTAITSFVLLDEALTLLVDLPTLVREQEAARPPPASEERP
jgi:hypothetical protein